MKDDGFDPLSGLGLMNAQSRLAAQSLINIIEMVSTQSHLYAQNNQVFVKDALDLMTKARQVRTLEELTALQQQWTKTCLNYGRDQSDTSRNFVEQCGLQALSIAANAVKTAVENDQNQKGRLMTTGIKGRCALVTGSTSGIGLCIAETLCAQGVNVALNGLGDETEIEALRARLQRTYGVRVIVNLANLLDVNAIQSLIEDVKTRLGGLDILVNNAGTQFVSPIEDFPVDKWNLIIGLNLSAAFSHHTALFRPYEGAKMGAGLSILPQRMLWSPHRLNQPMWRRNMGF